MTSIRVVPIALATGAVIHVVVSFAVKADGTSDAPLPSRASIAAVTTATDTGGVFDPFVLDTTLGKMNCPAPPADVRHVNVVEMYQLTKKHRS